MTIKIENYGKDIRQKKAGGAIQAEVTPDLYTGRNAINYFNEFLECWKTLQSYGYKSIELYKIGCTFPKRILI